MDKKEFKKSGNLISRLGFGMMRLPQKADLSIDRDLTAKLVSMAIEGGVNYFDTAWPYLDGLSEVVTGELLSNYPRESFFLADKLPVWDVASEADAETIFNKQLEKCGVEYFDYYLLHNMTASKLPKVQKSGAIEYLHRQKEAGRIRNFGFSFHDTPAVLKEIVAAYDWDFTQIQLNYLDWDLLDARSQYQILTDRGIPVSVMEPVRGGALASLCPEAIAYLKEVDPSASPASWAIRFAASLPNVFVVLSGMNSIEQMQDNIQTVSPLRPWSEEDQKVIDKVLDIYRKKAPIPCTACRYCMDCPNGVDIPKNFAVYNRFLTSKNAIEFLSGYKTLGVEKQALNCVQCGLCQDKCPQKIHIPELMPEIQKAYEKIEQPHWFSY